jgi:hypothetical protein
MPQLQLPIFPLGLTSITEDLAFQREDGKVAYFHGMMVVFQHDEKDLKTFRMYTSQLIANGTVRQGDIVRAFKVPLATVKRYMKVHRQHGAKGFFQQARRRGAAVLTDDVRSRAQELLDEGKGVPAVAKELSVLADTLRKAIGAGHLHAVKKSLKPETGITTNKSERSETDSSAPMGYGATRSMERVAAAMGALEVAPIIFEAAQDIPHGGVLLALPALLAVGLLRHSSDLYTLPAGFYALSSIFLLLALMALARIPSLEQLRYVAAGEWGNLLGLDRIPEVRTLRLKVKLLCTEEGRAARWNAALAKDWITQDEQQQQQGLAFYVDGHVRVYHGDLTKLPRHYVARERLYMRATVDYWINALDGQPFFYVNKEVDHGLVRELREELVPWLEINAPISEEQKRRMDADPRVPRFTIVFDREGYSPELALALQKRRIAVLTYHRYPEGDWRLEEFQEQAVKLVSGETVRMKLAERGTYLGKRPGLWVREVRKLAPDGHQVSIVSTNFLGDAASQAAALMARWSQENFFKYMREHFGLDALVERGTEQIPATVTVLNPAWREMDRAVRQKNVELKRCKELQNNVSLDQPLSTLLVLQYEQQQGQLQERIEQLTPVLDQLKAQRKAILRQIPVKDLPEQDRFTRLRMERKHFLDTIKMIAYRAETSMAATVREKLTRSDDARALLRQIYSTEVDLIPDFEAKTLTVRLHHLTQAAHDAALTYLCDELTATETPFPGTDLRLVYKVGSAQIP